MDDAALFFLPPFIIEVVFGRIGPQLMDKNNCNGEDCGIMYILWFFPLSLTRSSGSAALPSSSATRWSKGTMDRARRSCSITIKQTVGNLLSSFRGMLLTQRLRLQDGRRRPKRIEIALAVSAFPLRLSSFPMLPRSSNSYPVFDQCASLRRTIQLTTIWRGYLSVSIC